jgi:general secretion pathway protein B
MSFILDALKKSETDRQRQSGPALFEVKVAPPRTRLPPWAFAIAALLVVNLAIVMWMLMRHPAHGAAPTAAASSGQAALASTAAPSPIPPSPIPPSPSASPRGAAPAVATGAPAPPASSVAATSPAPAAAPPVPPPAAAAPAADGPVASGATIGAAPAEAANPDDYAPAEEPEGAGALSGRVRRGTATGVPLYQDAATTTGAPLPQLRLDLHVYAVRPEERFVMINMHKLREGESLPEGVRVESITPEGAVLSYNGSRFMLPRE